MEGALTLSWRDMGRTAGILCAASLVGLLFYKAGITEANIVTVYLLAVLCTALATDGRVYGISAAVASVLVFNYLFTVPRFTLKFNDVSRYSVTFLPGSPFFRKPAGPCPAPSIHLIIAFSERNVSIRSFARHKDFFSDVKTILRSCFSVCRTVDPLHKKTVRVWNTHGSLFCFYFCPNSTLCSRSKFVYNLVDTANKNQQR